MAGATPAKRRIGQAPLWLAGAVALVLGVAACDEGTPVETGAPEWRFNVQPTVQLPDRYIIQFDPTHGDVPGLAQQLTRDHGGTLHFTYTRVLQGFAATLPAPAVEAIRRSPQVLAIEADQLVTADAVQSGATWGLDRADQRALPLSSTYSYGYTGQGVTAYIFDTGIRFDHVEFEGRARRGYDAIGDGRDGSDCNGHGTHVAGTVGGKTYGVAKGVGLVSMRVLGCDGYGSYSGMIAAMDWLVKNRTGPAVANFSLGGSVSSSLNTALANMIATGVQTSVSAGNNGGDACLKSPASTSAAVTVAATTLADARASYSNYGSCVDLFAPGTGIKSASSASLTGAVSMSGTSMASPHVAGVLALLQEQQPGLSAQQLRDWLINLTSKNIVTGALSANAHLLYSLGAGTSAPGSMQPATVPTAPSGLMATQSGKSQVKLAWSDRSANESGFRVDRKYGSGTWVAVGATGTGVTGFTDGGVQAGVTYWYRVSAYNSAGSSAFSNEAAATVTASKGNSGR